MGQIMKKILCSFLAVLMITSAVPVNAIALELEPIGEIVDIPEIEESLNNPKNGEYETMATPQYTITDTEIELNINKLKSLKGKYFTTDQTKNGDADVSKIITKDWLKKALGKVPTKKEIMAPGPYFTSNGGITKAYYGEQCFGFAVFASWYIFSVDSSSDLYPSTYEKYNFTYDNLVKYAKIGDHIRIGKGAGTDHSIIYLGDKGNNKIEVLHCNFGTNGGTNDNVNKIRVDTWYFDSVTGKPTTASASAYPYMIIGRISNVTVKKTDTVPVFGAEIIDPEGNVTDSIKIKKGDTFQLGIKIYPEDATNKAVTWSSRDTSVATVSSSGLVTAKGVGNTVIVAETKDGGYKITCDVEVTEKTCTVHFDVGGGYISTPDMEVPEGTYITIPEEIPVCPGNVFTGWQTTDSSEGEWTKTKPSSGSYETGYKYYIWGYEHNSDYTFVYGKNKDELISHVKSESKTFGSYNPSKMRYLYLIESSDKGSSFYPGKSGSNYNYFNADYIAEDGKTGTASIYKTEFYFESKVYKQDATVAVIYQPGDSYLVTKDTVFTALWENEPPTITVDSIEIFSGSAAELNIFIENNDATENLSFDLDLVYDKNAFEVAYVETFFPEDGVVSVNGDNVKYDVVDGETGAFSGLFLCVVLNVKDVEEKDYNFSINVNKWVNGFGSVEPKVVDGTIHVLNQAYTVTFDPGKGTGGPENITVTGNEFTVPTEIPVRENWNFLFWMGQNGKGYYPGNTYSITENLDLVAIFEPGWIPEISVENIKGKPGEAVEILVTVKNNTEIPDRYSFVTAMEPFGDYVSSLIFTPSGKNLPENGIMGKFTFDIPEDAKVGTVYSISMIFDEWIVGGFDMASSEMLKITNGSITVEEPQKATFTVTYDANGGTGAPAAQTKIEGEALKLSDKKPVREGYEFLGWATSRSATTAQYQPGDSYTKDANVTLYAVWKQKEVIPEDAPTIVIGEVSGRPGEEVVVEISIKNNPGIAFISFPIEFDENLLEKVSIEGSGLNGSWQFGKNASWVGDNSEYNGVILTLTLKIKEDAEEGVIPIKIGNIESYNINEEEIVFAVDDGYVNIVNRIPGDTTGDGKVNGLDLLRLHKYVAGIDVEIDISAADVTGDGKVNGLDLLRLHKYIAGMDVVLK